MNTEGIKVEELEVAAVFWSPIGRPVRAATMHEALESYSLGLTEKVTTKGNGSWVVLTEQTGSYVIRLVRPLPRPSIAPIHAAAAAAIGG